MNYTAVIVTRGDVDLSPILRTLQGAEEIIIRKGHAGVWERWEAALMARHEIVYTQDDDCTVEVEEVLKQYRPDAVTCNMPAWKRSEYPDQIALVGWGAVLRKSFVQRAMVDYRSQFEADELFLRECDRVITGLNPVHLIDVPFGHLPWASAANRLSTEARHGDCLREIRRRVYAIRERNAA